MKRRHTTRAGLALLSAVALVPLASGCASRQKADSTSAAAGSTAAGPRANLARPKNAVDELPTGMANPNPSMESRPMSVPRR
jgi:hypothetical protein